MKFIFFILILFSFASLANAAEITIDDISFNGDASFNQDEVTITKDVDSNTPLIFDKFKENENIEKIVLIDQVVTDAKIISIKLNYEENVATEELKFTFSEVLFVEDTEEATDEENFDDSKDVKEDAIEDETKEDVELDSDIEDDSVEETNDRKNEEESRNEEDAEEEDKPGFFGKIINFFKNIFS